MSSMSYSDGEEVILEMCVAASDTEIDGSQMPAGSKDNRRTVGQPPAPRFNQAPSDVQVVVENQDKASGSESRAPVKTTVPVKPGSSSGGSSSAGSREPARNKRKIEQDVTCDELLRDSYADTLDTRVRLLAGVAAGYELCIWQHPVTYVDRQALLSACLLDDMLSHAAKKIDMIKKYEKLGPSDTKFLAQYLDFAPFVIKKGSVQWTGVTAGPHHYRHAPVYEYWSQNRGRVPAHIEHVCEILRLKFSIRIKELNTVLAMKAFGLTKDVKRDPNQHLYNPFVNEFTAPKPGSYDELVQQLSAANKELERAKGLAKTRQELEKQVDDMQQIIKEMSSAKQAKKDAEAQHKLAKFQLEEAYRKETVWSAEKGKMREEIRLLKKELEEQKGKISYVLASDVEKLFRQYLPSGAAGSSAAGRSAPAKRSRNNSPANGSDTENRRRSPGSDSDSD